MNIGQLVEQTATQLAEVIRGGPGSGHHGHKGRPGEVGGSLPSGAVAKFRSAATKYLTRNLINLDLVQLMDKEGKPRDGKYWLTPEGDIVLIYGGFTHGYEAEHAIEAAGFNRNDLIGRLPEGTKHKVNATFQALLIMQTFGYVRLGLSGPRWGSEISFEMDRNPTGAVKRNIKDILAMFPDVKISYDLDTSQWYGYESEPKDEDIGDERRKFEAQVLRQYSEDIVIERGGPGSGHHEHEGRPGEVGGSLPGDGWLAEARAYADRLRNPAKKKYAQEFINVLYFNEQGFYPPHPAPDQVFRKGRYRPPDHEFVKIFRELSDMAPPPLDKPDFDELYPVAGDEVGGREIRLPVPNTDSISASFMDYEILDDIREVQMADFFSEGQMPYYYSVDKRESTRELVEALKTSDWIEPLIVGVEMAGPHVLEGSHRIDALRELGEETFPAMIVIDRESLVERGGEGSGHFEHEGRPGEVGGSLPGNGRPRAVSVAEAERSVGLALLKWQDDTIEDIPKHMGKRVPEGMRYEPGRWLGLHSEGFGDVFREMAKSQDNPRWLDWGYVEEKLMRFERDMEYKRDREWIFEGELSKKDDARRLEMIELWKKPPFPLSRMLSRAQKLNIALLERDEIRVLVYINLIRDSKEQMLKQRYGPKVFRGGPGSGHFEHEGRPGEVGGSLPSGEVAVVVDERPWKAPVESMDDPDIAQKAFDWMAWNYGEVSIDTADDMWIGPDGRLVGVGWHSESVVLFLESRNPQLLEKYGGEETRDQLYSGQASAGAMDLAEDLIDRGLIRLKVKPGHGFVAIDAAPPLTFRQKQTIQDIIAQMPDDPHELTGQTGFQWEFKKAADPRVAGKTSGYAVYEFYRAAGIIERSAIERHASPTHPGTGTEQQVHAGDGAGAADEEGKVTSDKKSNLKKNLLNPTRRISLDDILSEQFDDTIETLKQNMSLDEMEEMKKIATSKMDAGGPHETHYSNLRQALAYAIQEIEDKGPPGEPIPHDDPEFQSLLSSDVALSETTPVIPASAGDAVGPQDRISLHEGPNFYNDEDGADYWGRENFPDQYHPDQFEALTNYKSNTYEAINRYLRGTWPHAKPGWQGTATRVLDEQVSLLDSVMVENATPEDIIAFRGMNLEHIANQGSAIVGSVFTDGGFVSTSLAQEDSLTFAASKDNGVMARIFVPAGTHATYMDFDQMRAEIEGDIPVEEELLLDRGLSFRVIAYRTMEECETCEVDEIDLVILR